MRVFVTGATGFIGSAIVQDLIAGGHEVLGLVRDDAKAAALGERGAVAHRGDLDDVESLIAGARASEGVIHTAYGHDFSKYLEAGQTDLRAVKAMTEALAGSGKPLVIASGTALVASDRLATERDAAPSEGLAAVRGPSEAAILGGAGQDVRTSLVRLAPAVHDRTRAGLVTRMMDIAREKGVSAYVGDGRNRWPAVHRLDAARLFVLALERAEPGARLHAAAEEGIALRSIAEAIGETLGLPVRALSPEEAFGHFGWLAAFVGVDNRTSSAITRETLGWTPREAGLLDDVRQGEMVA
jgi:nucleoside-diphosphate-sugar epimerase